MKRNPFSFGRLLAAAVIFSASFGAAHAQPSRCSNAQVNAAYVTMLRAANGSGNSGECDPGRYGPWTSQQDLNNRVAHSMDCPDPWIGVIYSSNYHRRPTAAECNIHNYNNGSWNGYGDLATKIDQYLHPPKAPAGDFLVIPTGALVDSNGTVVATPGSYLVSDSGGTLVASGAGNLINPTPGMLISNDGTTLQRSIMSNGKRVIKARILKR